MPDPFVISTDGLRDFGQVADARPGNYGGRAGRRPGLDRGKQRLAPAIQRLAEALVPERTKNAVEQRRNSVVVDPRGDRPVYRHRLRIGPERLPVPDHLLADVAQRVGGAFPVELVDRDNIGEIQHVDLLELGRRAEFRRHDVEAGIRVGRDRGVALADAGSLHDDQVEARELGGPEDFGQGGGDFAAGGTGAQRSHEDVGMADRVHAYAIAQQSPAGPAAGRIHRDDPDAQVIPEAETEAAHQFVGKRGLAGPSRAGYAQNGSGAGGFGPIDAFRQAAFNAGDGAAQRAEIAALQPLQRDAQPVFPQGLARFAEHVQHHPLQPHLLAVVGRVDAGYSVFVKQPDLFRDDDASTAAEDPDVTGASCAQHVQRVFEVLEMAALIGTEGDGVRVLMDGRGDDLLYGAVVAEVDDFGAGGLEQAPYDIDGGVVAVEEARGGYESKRETFPG